MSVFFYIVSFAVVGIALFIITKAGFQLKKRNESLLENEKNIAYLKADGGLIIRYVNSEQITPNLLEITKTSGQEVIVLAGEVTLTLSYYNTKGVPGIVKINTKIKEHKVNVIVEAGQAYIIYYDSDKGFYVESPEKWRWKNPLYKKFKQKFSTIVE